jgi:sensory rhodopsin
MIEFYLILSAIAEVSVGIFWRLTLGSLVMLIGGYVGEAGYFNVWISYIVGMFGWAFIIYEVFAGEASKVSATQAPENVQKAFNTMRWIVTIGWAIYPIGYYVGYLSGSDPASSMATLNIIYNLADVLNKIAFGLIIWSVAVSESK